jgi:hypothetical protein
MNYSYLEFHIQPRNRTDDEIERSSYFFEAHPSPLEAPIVVSRVCEPTERTGSDLKLFTFVLSDGRLLSRAVTIGIDAVQFSE